MTTEPLVYLNGAFIPQSQAHLALNDAGFIFGATVTDLCRTFRHQLFRLDAHLIRFRNSCQLARVPLPLDDDQLAFVAQELVRHNALLLQPEQDLALVMFATPGAVGYYLGQPGGPGEGTPTLCMHTFPLPFQRYVRLIQEGARLIIPDWRRQVPARCVSPAIKHRSRLHWWLAEQEVHETDPAASALLLDPDGYITETATANFLLVLHGRLCSPPRDRILGGISLMVVEELCHEIGFPFVEEDLQPEHLLSATEAMLSSTPYGLAPVSSLNGRPLSWPGPVCKQLIEAWNRKVGLDIWAQICSAAPA